MEKKIIIITGGANGLGYELVEQAIKNNLFVCNLDRDKEKMDLLSEKFKENYKGFIGDVSDEEFVKETVMQISAMGEISVLINNAGEPSFKMPKDYNKTDIEKCFKELLCGKKSIYFPNCCGFRNNRGAVSIGLHSSAFNATKNHDGRTVNLIVFAGEKRKIVTMRAIDTRSFETKLNSWIEMFLDFSDK